MNELKYVVGEMKSFFNDFMGQDEDMDIMAWFNTQIVYFSAKLADRGVRESLNKSACWILENKCILNP